MRACPEPSVCEMKSWFPNQQLAEKTEIGRGHRRPHDPRGRKPDAEVLHGALTSRSPAGGGRSRSV
jgi:hypothetical protein